jgi:hypothetical protein
VPPPKRASAQGNPEARGGAGSRGTRQLGPKDRGLEAANGRLRGQVKEKGLSLTADTNTGNSAGSSAILACVHAPDLSTRRHQDNPLPSRPAAKSQRRRNQISRPPIDRGPLAPIPSGHRQARGDPQMVRLCRPPALASWHDLNRHVRASSRTDLIDALPPTSICSGAARIGKGTTHVSPTSR